ncbi:hypothetical protein [Xanthomarina gelatinilytica]|uniref:hypothetical protein n=1 Tax=Xanthomarina gelatinilytica TaxID=1137281 RepID=UPI003AA95098
MEEKKPKENKDIFDETLTDITRNYIHQAPVELPNQEQLTVKLVSVSLIEKLIESKSDYEMYLSILFTFIGTLMGSILTVLTIDDKTLFTNHLIGFLVVLIIIIIFLGVRLFTLRKRYLEVKKHIFINNG